MTPDSPPQPSYSSPCGRVTLYLGDCLERLKELPDNSVDSIVTDPPYGLGKEPDALAMLQDWLETGHHEVKGKGFMGKEWDAFVPQPQVWRECLRVLKPGGHLLAFAGTRTQDLMCLGLRLAGFEIRDMVAWVYGSGFPKSLDVSKALDKMAGAEREVIGVSSTGAGNAGIMNSQEAGSDAGGIAWDKTFNITAPATDAAKQWDGWGTALKPSFESLTFATKPLGFLGYCAKMILSLNERIESCKLNASTAEKSSKHFQADSQEARINSAQENAAIPIEEALERKTETGAGEDTNSKADMLESTPEMGHIALSTFLSWKRTLEGVYSAAKMSTTSTAFEMTIDWKTLSYCLSQITPDIITREKLNPSGLSADALRATQYLSVSLACLKNTLELSALAPAMWQEAETCRGAGVSPNLEPITLARKPLEGTVAANVLKWHVGGLNIDGCRVGTEENLERVSGGAAGSVGNWGMKAGHTTPQPQGRFPANLIHDGSDEVVGLFPETTSGKAVVGTGKGYAENASGISSTGKIASCFADKGSAARFFYCAKTSKKDRNDGCNDLDDSFMAASNQAQAQLKRGVTEHQGDSGTNSIKSAKNNHPTVKPTDLMRYLCRLITPPSGVILDPYMGSGSTGKAAMQEGNFSFIGIERDPDYFRIAETRITTALNRIQQELAQGDLFLG